MAFAWSLHGCIGAMSLVGFKIQLRCLQLFTTWGSKNLDVTSWGWKIWCLCSRRFSHGLSALNPKPWTMKHKPLKKHQPVFLPVGCATTTNSVFLDWGGRAKGPLLHFKKKETPKPWGPLVSSRIPPLHLIEIRTATLTWRIMGLSKWSYK